MASLPKVELTPMKNTEIAGVFANIADLLELKGENPFKIRASRNYFSEDLQWI